MYPKCPPNHISIGIIDDNDFSNFISDEIITNLKIYKNFKVTTNLIKLDTNLCNDFNHIFFIVKFNDINNKNILNAIKQISTCLVHPRNHLFIIIDSCVNMSLDDDDELVFDDNESNQKIKQFEKNICPFINSDHYDLIKMNSTFAKIYKSIIDEGSISKISNDDIDVIAESLIPKSNKLSITDKKREIKLFFKKVSIEDKLVETGFNDLEAKVMKYFGITNQKKIVCSNYSFIINNFTFDISENCMNKLELILTEINSINYLKPDILDGLILSVSEQLDKKLLAFFTENNNKIGINVKNGIDVYQYQSSLNKLLKIICTNNLNISKNIEKEKDKINDIIISHHSKEVEKTSDLDKIFPLLEIFAAKDKNNLFGLFDKLSSNSKLIKDNMDSMDKWTIFVDKCTKIGIPKQSIINLIEKIIIEKISHYCDISKAQKNSDLSIIYPHCLHSFLLSNMNKHFIFKKLDMITCYHMRYSGRNILDTINNLTSEQYDSLLTLEYKLLNLVNMKFEDYSQRIDTDNVNIVEVFNAQ